MFCSLLCSGSLPQARSRSQIASDLDLAIRRSERQTGVKLPLKDLTRHTFTCKHTYLHGSAAARRWLPLTTSATVEQQESAGADPAELLLQQLKPEGEDESVSKLQLGWTLTTTQHHVRGVQATGSHAPGSKLLSIPSPFVLTDIDHDRHGDTPWSGYLAVRLLQKIHACKRQAGGDIPCVWVDTLPGEASPH